MIKATVVSLFSFSAFIACSGYEGGGDVRIVPLADTDAAIADAAGRPSDAGPSPRDAGRDSSGPRASSVIAYYALDSDGVDRSPAMTHLDMQITNPSFTGGGIVDRALSVTTGGWAAQRPQNDSSFAFGSRDFTVQAWIGTSNPLAVGTRQVGFSQADGWLLVATSSSVSFQTNDPQGPLSVPSLPSTNAYRQVVVRRQSKTVTIFVNGEPQVSRGSSTPIGSGTPFGISRTGAGSASLVDEVVIWSRALSDAEIAANYEQGMVHSPTILTE